MNSVVMTKHGSFGEEFNREDDHGLHSQIFLSEDSSQDNHVAAFCLRKSHKENLTHKTSKVKEIPAGENRILCLVSPMMHGYL
jgi:hypothetical protein